jgi:hypothetical protein
MTNQHPIIPPSELVEQWRNSKILLKDALIVAAQWGADQELEACCAEVLWQEGKALAAKLRDRRRPKPPSLNSIALQMLDTIERDAHYIPEITDTIRRALEALPE